MQRFLLASVFVLSPVFSDIASASGISPYLPLKLAAEIETYIEQVMAITPNTPLTKPYKAIDLLTRVKLIKDSHPRLYQRLNSYLARYKRNLFLAHASAEVGFNSGERKFIPNQRGLSTENRYQISVSGYAFASPYFYAAAGAQYSDDNELEQYNSHLAFGFEYLQIELGYREHWFSPFQDSAMLVSSNAQSSPSITLSNATPITSWDIRYEIFYSELERVEGIRLGDDIFPGKPRHGGVHVSFSPLENWTIGLNRTLQFGGGQRKVSFSDVLEAFFDPAGKDNVDGSESDDPNFEFGNQQASITTKVNFDLGMPVSVYAEYGGEDTVNESNFSLGNNTTSIGIYLPLVREDLSLRYEYSNWSTRWYIHPLYQSGYTNNGNVLGHWGGDSRVFNDDPPADTHSVNVNWNIVQNQLLNITLRAIRNKNSTQFDYETGMEIQADYSYATDNGFYGIGLYAGKDVFGDSFGRLTTYYRW